MDLLQNIIVTLIGSASAYWLAIDHSKGMSIKETVSDVDQTLRDMVFLCFDRFDASKTAHEREHARRRVISDLSKVSAMIQRLEVSKTSSQTLQMAFVSLKRDITGPGTRFEDGSEVTLPSSDNYFLLIQDAVERFAKESADVRTPLSHFARRTWSLLTIS